MFVDTYVKADSFEILAPFCAYFRNVIGPQKGIEAVPEYTDENGVVFPAQEAKGDPTKFYACIRSPGELALPEGIDAVSDEEGSSVVGVWA